MPQDEWGGPWTEEKLKILASYLEAYLKVMKKTKYKVIYIDAFAGTGRIESKANYDGSATRSAIDGSARVALEARCFDKFILIEKNKKRFQELRQLKEEYSHLSERIEIYNEDANSFLMGYREDWQKCRGVLFVDPWATAFEWSTAKKIAGTEALDTWILFLVSAVSRMLSVSKRPEDTNDKLTRIFGDRSWEDLYENPRQSSLFPEIDERDRGVSGIVEVYKDNLKMLFGERFLKESVSFENSKKSMLFQFLFCAGSPGRGRPIAHRIALALMKKFKQRT